MLLVARVDAFRAVTRVEIDVELETGDALEDRHADFFGAAGIDGGFVHHDVALLQHLADGLARFDQRRQVGALVLVDRRRHRDDEDAAGLEVLQLSREAEQVGFGEFPGIRLERAVVAVAKLLDALRLDVETDGLETLAELHGERQADIAEADDANLEVAQVELFRHEDAGCCCFGTRKNAIQNGRLLRRRSKAGGRQGHDSDRRS